MSKAVAKASRKAPGGSPKNRPLDFLYHDSRRIGSYLAQIDPYGHLTGFKYQETKGGAAKTSRETGGEAGIHIVKGTRKGGAETTEHESQTSELLYDPLWLNARQFIAHVEEQGLLSVDLSRARMGHLVRVSGSPAIVDMSVVPALLTTPKLRQKISDLREKLPTDKAPIEPFTLLTGPDEKIEIPQTRTEQTELALAMLDLVPWPIQLTLSDGRGHIWGTLDKQFIVGAVSDIMLKHGDRVGGDWSVVGIIDALPEASAPGPLAPLNDPSKGLAHAIQSITRMARTVAGRPHTHFGITPLLIYREISG